MRRLGRIAPVMIAGLGLAGCGTASSPQDFYAAHMRCPSVWYDEWQWSPDGSLIYYTIFFNNRSTNELHVVSNLGHNDQLLINDLRSPQISPDGTTILFERFNLAAEAESELYVLDLNTSIETLVVRAAKSGAWSPDSQWIAYVTFTALVKANVKTGEIVTLSDNPDSFMPYSDPQWSPDGRMIAFIQAGGAADGGIYVIQADGSHSRRLVKPTKSECSSVASLIGFIDIGWLPDSQAVTYGENCNPGTILHVASLSGDDLDLITLGLVSSPPEWSPDGRNIAYFSDAVGPDTLMLADADGSNPRTVQMGKGSPRWSPDGQQILFAMQDRDQYDDLYTIHPDGTGLTQLTQNPGRGQICLH